ncbi:hypothetical protein ASR47_10405 [Janthinobacterium psychrotolerans]|uniref:Uncharacterized protein n=1 Tax=Janthinobacterium psychrotolerans TaxID=1747903 RepID=A0A1A7CA52_9BURK|nr:hypothetical protein ASR47_10405 [Janthinobacterium psychrotolerans]
MRQSFKFLKSKSGEEFQRNYNATRIALPFIKPSKASPIFSESRDNKSRSDEKNGPSFQEYDQSPRRLSSREGFKNFGEARDL